MLVYDIIISTKYRKEVENMSIVRYVDKKTGRTVLYESTSYYDPVKKQSRPKRKYLGVEDPVTGELIPSTRKPGRKPKSETEEVKTENKITDETDYEIIAKNLQEENETKDKRIKELENKVTVLEAKLERIREIAKEILK